MKISFTGIKDGGGKDLESIGQEGEGETTEQTKAQKGSDMEPMKV